LLATTTIGKMTMSKPRFITAAGTPLTDDDQLHVEGLSLHLEDQAQAGIDSLLMGGTMGMMPLQTDQTWRDLIEQSVALGGGRFEMLVGATDLSTSRALGRVEWLNTVDGIDGVVVMVPGVLKFTEPEYIAYFTDLADASHTPIYLYDLEPLTGVHLSVQTVLKLAEHPNIAGIKLSANVPEAARIHSQIAGSDFRLIVAEPGLSDMLFRHGYNEQLDGIYAIAPHWAAALAEAAGREDWDAAAQWQEKLTRVKELFLELPFSKAITAAMNLRGLPGKFAPRPMSLPDEAFMEELRQGPVIAQLLADSPVEA